MIKYSIFGTSGKMVQALLSVSNKITNAKFISAIGREINSQDLQNLDFIVDFSTPQGSLNLLKATQNLNILVVSGTTGFTKSEFEEFQNLSNNVKVLYSTNFSLGLLKITEALKNLSLALKDYDVEILEKHHNLKKDAPSGTAISLGEVIAEAKGLNFEDIKSMDRNHKRKQDEIGYACMRQGSIFGFHEVCFASEDERIWIGHEAFNKNIFARGAIDAGIEASMQFKNLKSGFFSLKDLKSNIK